ncbi:MAG: NUDIX hydrolase [Corynebacterium sp.]|nr:NUDIX hydrolase [Corynebacterium sp.]
MGFDFQTVSSELITESPILALRRDEVSMPSGGTAHRDVVEHLGAVAVVALDTDGNIAMVNQYRHSVKRRLWELPAGLLDVRGESELAGAKRELQEEAGLAADSWAVLCDLVTSPGFSEEAVRIFLARDLYEVDRLTDTGDEEDDMEFRWIALDDAVREILSGEIVNSIAIAGIFAAHEVVERGNRARNVEEAFDLRPTSIASRRRGEDLKALDA